MPKVLPTDIVRLIILYSGTMTVDKSMQIPRDKKHIRIW